MLGTVPLQLFKAGPRHYVIDRYCDIHLGEFGRRLMRVTAQLVEYSLVLVEQVCMATVSIGDRIVKLIGGVEIPEDPCID